LDTSFMAERVSIHAQNYPQLRKSYNHKNHKLSGGLAFNLNSALKRLVLGQERGSKRLKAVRFAFISLPGRVVRRARTLIIRLAGEHPAYPLLLMARQRVLALAQEPP